MGSAVVAGFTKDPDYRVHGYVAVVPSMSVGTTGTVRVEVYRCYAGDWSCDRIAGGVRSCVTERASYWNAMHSGRVTLREAVAAAERASVRS